MKDKNIVTEWNTNYVPVKDENGNIVEDENGRQKFATEKDTQTTVSLKGVAAEAAVVGGVITGIAIAGAGLVYTVGEVYDRVSYRFKEWRRKRKEKKEADITGR